MWYLLFWKSQETILRVFYWDIYMHVTAQRGEDLLQQIPVIISRWEEGVAVAKGY